MTVDEMKRRKRELGYTYEQISEFSGVPLGTVQKIFSGHTKSPRYDTLRALEKVLGNTDEHKWEMKEANLKYAVAAGNGGIPGSGKRQGEYTIEDYFSLPDERRVELIDGVIYDMTAPSLLHQQVCGFITSRLRSYIFGSGKKCVVSQAPTDVWLDMDDKTMVQPDVLVVCSRNQINIERINGAPDFVVEVLSPSTRNKDIYVKGNKYLNSGVKELWLVDTQHHKVIVHDYDNDDMISIYSFDEKVPVNITKGDLQIDFSEMRDYFNELFGPGW